MLLLSIHAEACFCEIVGCHPHASHSDPRINKQTDLQCQRYYEQIQDLTLTIDHMR